MEFTHDQQGVRDLYDRSAEGWVRNQPLSLSDFTGRPPVLALCQPVAGLRILDLGCGEGYCARQLRRSGAAEVIGIDISGSMIAAAQREEGREPLGIRFLEGNAIELSRFVKGPFDALLAMFCYNYLTAAETATSFAEVFRVLRPGGRFVFAVPHPSLPYLRPAEPPFFFQTGGAGYFSGRDVRYPGKIWKRDGSTLEVQMVHKTLEDYFDALRGAGFQTLPIVRELHVTPEIMSVDPSFFGPLGDVPLHLALAITR